MKDKRVAVVWHDAASHATGWTSRRAAEAYTPYVCETVGWLLRNDKHAVVIASTKGPADTFCETMDIPRGMIVSVKTLR